MNTADQVIETLNDLIKTCKDGEYGFRAGAGQVDSESLRTTLSERAESCKTAADELQTHVVRLGGKPDETGSVSGAMHRGWISVKTALSTQDDLAVLDECERGEDAALASYRKAQKAELPPELKGVIERQAAGAQRNHDQIRDLRNSMRATT